MKGETAVKNRSVLLMRSRCGRLGGRERMGRGSGLQQLGPGQFKVDINSVAGGRIVNDSGRAPLNKGKYRLQAAKRGRAS